MQEQLKMWLFDTYAHQKGIHLAFGYSCTEAAKKLAKQLELHDNAWETFSVGGTWNATEGESMDLGSLWPYFTTNPNSISAINVVKSW